jgi:ribosome-binding protein aMBF1 (putative translation factor)
MRILKVRGLFVIKDVHIDSVDTQGERKVKKLFGARVRHFRQQKGMSQESLALACDLDRTYIGSVERGERNISLVNIRKISRALGVPPGDLFTETQMNRCAHG